MALKVAVGISGGVDSAVAALLLRQKGFDVCGVFMKNWDIIDETGLCTGEKDLEDAKIVCKKLDIPLKQVDFVKEYWNEVFTNFIKDYECGLTPNPDILCNRKVKFNSFYSFCRNTLKVDAIATGHYANTSFGRYLEKFLPDNRVKLLRPRDKIKDQTFFLSQVEQEPLQHTMFPLAPLLKSEVRKIADDHQLYNVSKKKDSRGICFVGKRKFKQFISEYVTSKPGDFIDIDTGKKVGIHSGIHNWTIGQRSHIGGLSKPYYIIRKNVKENSMYVCSGNDHPALKFNILITEKPHWIFEEPVELQTDCVFKCFFRYQHSRPLISCIMMKTDLGLLVQVTEPLRAITQGQYGTFYNGEECLGGARIIQLGPSLFIHKEN